MSYIINTYNGSKLAVIADGTINTSTELTFVGKNYSGYGTFQNENFLYLLENFSNINSPSKPIIGQLWFDSNTNKLKLYDKNSYWRTVTGSDTSTTQPTTLSEGDFWFDTTKKQLYVYSASGYTLVGPPAVNTESTTFESMVVTDTTGTAHDIIVASVRGNILFTVSTDQEFTLQPDISAIAGYTKIYPGLTLKDTNDPLNPGFTQGTTIPYRFNGTATNTDTINIINDSGVIVNKSIHASIILPTSNKISIVARNSDGDINVHKMYGIAEKSDQVKVGTAYVSASIDAVNNTIVCRTAQAVGNVPAGAIKVSYLDGTAKQSDKLLVSGYYYSASLSSTGTIDADTIPVRDSSGDIYANVFHGIATQAQYADLAEKYLADEDYEVGTVVMIGGDKEITACKLGSRAIGVISKNPAYMMNAGLENGVYVALKGRVPVKVFGSVNKGDRLISGDNGVARVPTVEFSDVFAIALETNTDDGIKLIEAVIL